MATIEVISKFQMETLLPGEEIIDVRTVTLPHNRPIDDGFDPREHRTPRATIKPYMAYFNLLRSCFGPGIVGTPMLVSQAGIILGPLMSIATGLLVNHTHKMLLNSLNEISRQLKISNISYRYGFRIALKHGPPFLRGIGGFGPTIIAIFMVISQVGICTLFVIFTSDNLRDIMDWDTNEPALMVLFVPYLVLEMSMKNLNVISHMSMLGNVFNIVNLILVIYAIVQDPQGEVEFLPTGAVAMLLAFGNMLFNMSVIGVMLSCEKALLDPKLMSKRWGILNVGILTPTVFATFIGVLGYWSFGVMEENVLRSLPYDESTTITNFAFYVVAIALSYPIQCYPAIQIICEVIKNHDPMHSPSTISMNRVEFFVRPLFVLTTFLMAHAIPFQGPLNAFIGNLCTTFLALIFPAMMDIGIRYPFDYGWCDYILIKDILIILLGVVCFFYGVILCGYLIYIRLVSYESASYNEYL